MNKKMLINASHAEEHRAAIVEDGALTELEIEVVGREQTRGNIYKAVVVRVETGLQAAFVDYGADRLGFLQMGEIHPACYRNSDNGSESKSRPRINDVLHRGQELLVQVVKEERGTKGAALTTFLSLPGRYMVLMPESDTKGVSRKIEEESQRKKLKSAMASMDLPGNMGYIVRTAGIGQPKEELKRDFDYLLRVYENILAQAKRAKAPALVYKESNLVIRMIRDYFNTEIDEVLVDDPKVFQEARDFFQQVMPEYARLVKLHQEKRPIFSRYQIEEQIETINKNKVPLPSGGSIVIDATEALVAIDVNSGKMASEQGVEATAYKTNLEAAAEIGRQLRLRDLGGLIVIDFIDMRDRKHVREVEKCLKEALKMDKARVTVGHISSQFSLLEMSRQRIKTTLAEGAFLTCPHCDGSGRIKSTEAQAVAFMRKLQAGIAKGQIGVAEGEVPLEVATYLLNARREDLLIMERQHKLSIVIRGRADLRAGQFELTFAKREKEEPAPEYVDAGSAAPTPLLEFDPVAAEIEEDEDILPETETTTGEGGEEAGKKKRKRRRKKKAGKTSPTATEPTTDETTEEAEDDEEENANDPEDRLETSRIEVTTATSPSVGDDTGEEDAPDDEVVVSETAAGVEGEAKPVKKARRRRRKKPAAATMGKTAPAETDETLPVGEATGPASELPETVSVTSPAGEEPRKKRPARRKRKKPAAAVAETTGETESLPPQVEKPGPESAATATESVGDTPRDEPAKPARNTRRAPRKKAEAPEPEGTAESSVAPEANPAETPKPARKPRAPRAPKSQGDAPPTGDEQPKRRTPRRKTAKPTTED